jgi:XTP/dITP diphosphohydrolase
MEELIFATHNLNKVIEVRSLLPEGLRIISLDEAGLHEDIPEPFDTLEANAREKAAVIFSLTKKDCFSEDTGLEVDALGGAPGVLSARYAGPQKSAKDNVALLISRMKGKADRSARFRTVISLFLNGAEYQFEGVCPGRISETVRGEKGFGYDPVFIPEGAERTFALMPLEEKNRYSHRARALKKLAAFLQTKTGADGQDKD